MLDSEIEMQPWEKIVHMWPAPLHRHCLHGSVIAKQLKKLLVAAPASPAIFLGAAL